MKFIRTAIATGIMLSATALQAQPEVFDARYLAETNEIEIDVGYSGCAEQEFHLKLGQYCAESYPPMCSATVENSGPEEDCEAYFSHSFRVDNPAALPTPNYLTISGANDSSVTIFTGKE